jgi:hypothetical protein
LTKTYHGSRVTGEWFWAHFDFSGFGVYQELACDGVEKRLNCSDNDGTELQISDAQKKEL